MYRILKAKAKGLGREAVDLARELVRMPGGSLEESWVAKRVRRAMEEAGYDRVFVDDAGNVVGVLHGRAGDKTILLNSHLDTAAPGNMAAWERDPYSAGIADGRLYGLGASDCKGGLAAQIFGGALLKRSLLPLDGNLVVAATVAQEDGHSAGVHCLMEETLPSIAMRPDWAILGEPTRLGLYYGHEGWVELEVRVESANPFDADDAAAAIANVLDGTANAPDASRNMLLRETRFEESRGLRRAVIGIDRRLYLGETIASVVGDMTAVAQTAAKSVGSVAVGVAVRRDQAMLYTGRKTEVQCITHAWAIDPFHRLMERSRHALTAAGLEARPGKWRLGRLGMGTAGGVLVGDFDVPTIGYGPGDEAVAHRPNEFVETRMIEEAVYGTAAVAHSLIGVPVYGWTSDEI